MPCFAWGAYAASNGPRLTALFPVRDGQAVVLDIGANTDCKPEYLLQFAVLGSVYAETVLDVASPRVAILSNGEEAGKGNLLVKEATPMLAASGLNFIGNVEAKELYAAAADVIVTDGFVGNVFLKTSEAVASFLSELIKQEITSSPVTSVGGLLARPAFRRVNAILDPAKYGAAPLLGVDGLVFIGHGRFGAEGVVSGIRVARQAVQGELMSGPAHRHPITPGRQCGPGPGMTRSGGGRRVVVTGMGIITSLGSDLESFWTALLEGRSGVRQHLAIRRLVFALPDRRRDPGF